MAMRLCCLLSGLVLAQALIGCATPQVVPAPIAPPPTAQTVDFANVFGGRSSGSIYDLRVAKSTTMQRVLLEPQALSIDDAAKGMESWTRRKLIQTLGQKGSTVLAPPPASCAPGGCYDADPTAALRNLQLVSARDDVKVRVTRNEDTGHLEVALHRNLEDPSLCPKGFTVKIGFVQLLGQVQSLPKGEIVAVFQELALLDAPQSTTVQVTLPDPSESPQAFCSTIAEVFEAVPGLAVDDERYERAARDVLRVALHPIYPKRSDK